MTEKRKNFLIWFINGILLFIISIFIILFFADHEIKLVNKQTKKQSQSLQTEQSAKKEHSINKQKNFELNQDALLTTDVKVKVNGTEVSTSHSVAKVKLDRNNKVVVIPEEKSIQHQQKSVIHKNESLNKNVEIVEDNYQEPKIYKPLQKDNADIFISRDSYNSIDSMETINGNLYLENMYSYKLPCGVTVNGNLFVRNVKQLKFCGCFRVNGNIYVSQGTSFGAIPQGSTIKGQIIM